MPALEGDPRHSMTARLEQRLDALAAAKGHHAIRAAVRDERARQWGASLTEQGGQRVSQQRPREHSDAIDGRIARERDVERQHRALREAGDGEHIRSVTLPDVAQQRLNRRARRGQLRVRLMIGRQLRRPGVSRTRLVELPPGAASSRPRQRRGGDHEARSGAGEGTPERHEVMPVSTHPWSSTTSVPPFSSGASGPSVIVCSATAADARSERSTPPVATSTLPCTAAVFGGGGGSPEGHPTTSAARAQTSATPPASAGAERSWRRGRVGAVTVSS